MAARKNTVKCLEVGQEVGSKVLKFDPRKQRISLGGKQLGERSLEQSDRRYPYCTRLFGKVSNLTDYGAFVEIETKASAFWYTSPKWTGPTKPYT